MLLLLVPVVLSHSCCRTSWVCRRLVQGVANGGAKGAVLESVGVEKGVITW